jgi:DNA-binding LytR/AlgR family response regulator
MNVLIVEDEAPAAVRLSKILKKIDPLMRITGVAETVEEAINRLQDSPGPDLVLMDIQLGDGLCFEIFETINVEVPVIFTTAYDEYTLKAFKVNSVDYLLKPVEEQALSYAIEKFRKLYYDRKDPFRRDFHELINEFRNRYKSRFLIKIGDKFKSIVTSGISHFHISERSVFLTDNGGWDYGIDYSLEQLEEMLDPRKFFRINRECIVNIDSVTMMYSYSSSRLQLTMRGIEENELFVVSRDRVAEFKKWADR